MIAAVDWTAWLLLGLVLLVAIGAPLAWPRLVAWRRDRRECLELARGSGLDAAEAQVAWRLARRTTPALPLAVFLRPSLWDLAAARTGAAAAVVASIRGKLFG